MMFSLPVITVLSLVVVQAPNLSYIVKHLSSWFDQRYMKSPMQTFDIF